MTQNLNEKFFNQQISSDAIIDPSILILKQFWDSIDDLPKKKYYVPGGLWEINEEYLTKYYGGYRKKGDLLRKKEILRLCENNFAIYNYQKEIDKIDGKYKEKIFTARERYLKDHPSINIITDESVFLLSKSTMLTRLKKTLKIFENFNVFPLINLENSVPPEWKESIKGLKKFTPFVKWFAMPVSIILGPPTYSDMITEGILIEGIRILIIDP